MNTIHDRHGALTEHDYKRLKQVAETQEQRVLQILRSRSEHHFAYFEIINRTGYDKDSAKRSLSNLSGSGNEKYKDRFGNWPVIYNKNRRKRNPDTATTCGTYQANPIYGVRPEITKDHAGEQSDMFGAPQSKHQGAYSGVGA